MPLENRDHCVLPLEAAEEPTLAVKIKEEILVDFKEDTEETVEDFYKPEPSGSISSCLEIATATVKKEEIEDDDHNNSLQDPLAFPFTVKEEPVECKEELDQPEENSEYDSWPDPNKDGIKSDAESPAMDQIKKEDHFTPSTFTRASKSLTHLSCGFPGCEYTTTSKKILKNHLAKKHKLTNKLKKCPHCDYSTLSKNNLKAHNKRHLPAGAKKFQCSFDGCEYGASRKSCLVAHLATKHDQTGHLTKCPLCDYTTPFSHHMKLHSERHIAPEERIKKYPCDFSGCEYSGAQKCDLSRHKKIHLPKCERVREFRCDFEGCGYSALRKYDLKRHSETHLDNREKKFRCEFPRCEYSTIIPAQLKRHSVTHLPKNERTRKFECGFAGCSYSAVHEDYLKKHSEIHLGDKKFKCEFAGCGYTTLMKSNLRRHGVTHLPLNERWQTVKTFKCTFTSCCYSTALKADLKRHYEAHFNPKKVK